MKEKVDPYSLIGNVMAILRKWDPIGVYRMHATEGWPPDEYDGYAPVIFAILMSGTNIELLANHLEMLRTKTIGMGPNRYWDEAIAQELIAWWEPHRDDAV